MADDLLAVELDNIAAMIGLASELPMTADPRRVVDVYAPRLLKAVRAALEHHQPAEWANGIRVCPLCSSADGKAVMAPCHEVRSITRALTGEASDEPSD